MSRLQRDIPATIAALRITRVNLTVFVESNENDAFVYERICQLISVQQGWTIEIRESREVLSASLSGGKTILERLFLETTQAGLLTRRDASGSKRSTAFILDKDIDDILHRAILHPHVIYTPTYHVENMLVLSGDFEMAVCAALSLNKQDAMKLSPNWKAKLQVASELWKDWVKVCILSIRLRIKFASTYSSTSTINAPLSSPADLAAKHAILSSLQARSSMTTTVFNLEEQSVNTLVDEIYGVGAGDAVFKGKWYIDIVMDEALRSNLTTQGKMSAQKTAIWAVLRATFDPAKCHWAYFSSRLSALLL